MNTIKSREIDIRQGQVSSIKSRTEGVVALAGLVVVLTKAGLVLGVVLTEARAGCAHDGGHLRIVHAPASAALLTLRFGL